MIDYPPVEQLIPHQQPMVLVNRIIDIGQDSIHCQVDIGEHNLFFNYGSQSIPAYVGIEFMAQSVAAWAGFHAMQQGHPPSIGFLLGSRSYTTACDSYQDGDILDVYAEKIMEDNGMAVFVASLALKGQKIGACQLNVYVPTEEKLAALKDGSRKGSSRA